MADVLDCIGNTPLQELEIPHQGDNWRVFAKLEFLNPSGSVKDRIARHILINARRRGELRDGMSIIEATSGNTGIALSMVGAVLGHKVIVVMPEHMSRERVRIMESLGAEVCLTSRGGSFAGAVEKVNELAQGHPTFYRPRQFENPDNVSAHQETTGQELLRQMGGEIDAFVAGVGTGGTLMGVGSALRERGGGSALVAVEPRESAVLSGSSELGEHAIAGIGDGFIPELLDTALLDDVVAIGSEDAIAMARLLASRFGLMVGVSSGANVLAAIETMRRRGRDLRVATVLADRSERYFSTPLHAPGSGRVHTCNADCECVFLSTESHST